MRIRLNRHGFGLLASAAAAAMLGQGASAETLADAMAKAYANNPSLSAARAGVRATDENIARERSAALGTITGDVTYGWRNFQSRDVTGARNRSDSDALRLGITGAIPIYSGGRISSGISSAVEGSNAARASLSSSEQDILLAAVTAYEDVRRDLNLVELSRNNVRVIGEQLRAARDRFEVGEVTRTDVSQAEARLAASRSALAANVGALERSRQAYLQVIGEMPVDLAPPPPLPDLPDTEAEALRLAETTHPLLRAARFQLRQAEYEVKRAIGGRLPTVSLEGSAGYVDDSTFIDNSITGDSTDLSVVVRGTIPIWTGGRVSAEVRQAQATLAQRQAQIHEVARRIRNQTSVAWANLRVARFSIQAAREQIRAAEIAFEGVQEEATLGARTTLDVLNAEQELLSARSDLVSSLRDEYVAGYSLLAAVGSLSVRHLGLKVDEYDPNAYTEAVEKDFYSYPRDQSTEWSNPLRP